VNSLYEVLFYDGEASPPAYYLIDGIEAESTEEALRNHPPSMVEDVRSQLHLGSDYPERRIREGLYLSVPGGLVGVDKGD
jgi:hypothetical protein